MGAQAAAKLKEGTPMARDSTSGADRDVREEVRELRIGAKVKGLRKARGWTLQRVSEKTGLSVPLLSQVENEQVTPPIATLMKIAAALDTSLAYFFADEGPETRITVVRADERTPIVRRGTSEGSNLGYAYQGLAHRRLRKQMEPFIVEYAPRDRADVVFMTHEGEEFHYVLQGDLEFMTPDEAVPLEKGDSIYFDASTPHAMRSVGATPGKSLVVVTPHGGRR